jgi:D-amino-acid dehydrogenase
VLTAAETAQLDPGVTMDVLGSVHYPQDCHLSPARYMEALETELRQRGAQFLFDTTLERIESRSGSGSRRQIHRLHAGKADWQTDALVLAAGVWSDALARQFDLRLPLQPGKGYSLTLDQPRQLPTLCSICTEARLAVTPMGDSLRVGGTMEIAGLNESISKRRVRGITRAFPEYFPAFQESDFAAVKPWSGLRPVSPDGLPYLGRPRHWDNLIVATGHAMMGLSLAPATGSIVSSLLHHEAPPFDLSLLSPDRFSRS